MQRCFATLLCLLVLSTHAHALDGQNTNTAILTEQIIPAYRALDNASAALTPTLNALCEAPSSDTMAAARAAYHRAVDAWQGVQHWRYGPVETLNRYHRLALWPDSHGTAARQITEALKSEPDALLVPDTLANASVALQGFSALTVVLFGRDDPTAFGRQGEPTYRCRYALTLSRHIATVAAAVATDWQQKTAPLRMMLSRTGTYLPDDAGQAELLALTEWAQVVLGQMTTQLQFIVDDKLAGPAGDGPKKVRWQHLEDWMSSRSARNLALNLQALRGLYETGFAPQLNNFATLQARLSNALDEAEAAVSALEDPLHKTLRTPGGWAQADAAVSALRRLLAVWRTDLPDALGIELGFNGLDGD